MSVKQLLTHVAIRWSRSYLQSGSTQVGKRFFWNKLCVRYLSWREDEVLCRTRFGAQMYARPCEFVEGRILFFGTWEPQVTAAFCETIRPGDVVLDVGANVGYFTLLAAKLVGPAGHVYAVEPSESIRSRLQRNLDLNGVKNVTVLACAAWDGFGEATFSVATQNRGASTLRPLEPMFQSFEERVTLAPLDEMIPADHASRISLVKLDIEGAELHALRGFARLLEANQRTTIIAEVNPQMLAELGDSADALCDWLRERGFSAQEIDNDYEVEAYLYPQQAAPRRPVEFAPTVPGDLLFKREAVPASV